ncbi:MAG: hypothetical protein R2712_28000 [Vicinamibacterales bacterium]
MSRNTCSPSSSPTGRPATAGARASREHDPGAVGDDATVFPVVLLTLPPAGPDGQSEFHVNGVPY